MKYAPVRIVTLNRHAHLRRCLESLEKNAWAGHTEIYVSVDYPVNESHWEGHGKIVSYLEEKAKKHGFLALHVYVQEKNLGPGANYQFLEDLIFQRHDRMISLEDDIEVSANFLEYMDKALAWGENQKQVFCVCGYFNTQSKVLWDMVSDSGCMTKSTFNPWGIGHYREEYLKLKAAISVEWMDRLAKNNRLMLELFLYRKYIFFMYVIEYLVNRSPVFFDKNGALRNIDIVTNLYMMLHGKCAVFPTASKTRNWGFDGSGQNCRGGNRKKYEEIRLDPDDRFELKEGDPIEISLKAMRRAAVKTKGEARDMRAALLYYFLYRLGVLRRIKK